MLPHQAGVHEQIDPGHIVLNYAYQMGSDFFAVANAALKLLEPHADAVGLVRSRMMAHLDKTSCPKTRTSSSCEPPGPGHRRDLSG